MTDSRRHHRIPELATKEQNVAKHYDLPREFFAQFLDNRLVYTCARFDGAMTLDAAQLNKIDNILVKAEIRPGQTLVDLGCGWGGLAVRARELGVTVHAATLSREQYDYNTRLGSDVRFVLSDWRGVSVVADAVVAVGLFEHVHPGEYGEFFRHCRRMLPQDGVLVVHTNVQARRPNRELVQFVRWIEEVIFPGGRVPAPAEVVNASRGGPFLVEHCESLRTHYETTLGHWHARLLSNQAAAESIVGEEKVREFLRYLSGYRDFFAQKYCDIWQYKLRAV